MLINMKFINYYQENDNIFLKKRSIFSQKNINSEESLRNWLTCFGWSAAFCRSVFTLLLGWFVILVTGCLKMEAVWRTGNVVFRSGLAFRTDKHKQVG